MILSLIEKVSQMPHQGDHLTTENKATYITQNSIPA